MASDPSPHENVDPVSDIQKPYQTPAEVSEDAIAPGLLASKRMWLGVIAALVVAGGALATYSFRQADYIKNFGDVRRRPIEVDRYVEDFGTNRGGPPAELPSEGASQESEPTAVTNDMPQQAPTP